MPRPHRGRAHDRGRSVPTDVLAVADRLWNGELSTSTFHPVDHMGGFVEITDGVGFCPSFANVSSFATEDGLVLVDTGSAPLAKVVHDDIRTWSPAPLHTAVYSHGHIDHVFGVPVWEEEAAAEGWAAPEVIAHHALPARFDRYIFTAGYNTDHQPPPVRLHRPELADRVPLPRPDLPRHAGRCRSAASTSRSATRRARPTTTRSPGSPTTRVLCCGDLFIWASPNAGNPQKVQRYPREWAAALRRMLELDAEFLLPGHGFPVIGADRVRQALTDTADLLDSLVDQTLAVMNAGGRLDDAIHTVRVPGALEARPYLRPVYDEPEFIVHTVWRQYGGWWDGNPATLQAGARARPGRRAGRAGRRARRPGRPGARAPGRRRRRARLRGRRGGGGAAPGRPPGRARLAGRPGRRGCPAGAPAGLRGPGRPGHLDHGAGRLHLGRQRVGGAPGPPTRTRRPPALTARAHRAAERAGLRFPIFLRGSIVSARWTRR